MILSVNELLDKLNTNLKNDIQKSKIVPVLSMIRVGGDPGSISYEKSVIQRAQIVGIELDINVLEENASFEEISSLINQKNIDKKINGILVFSPIKGQNMGEIFNLIDKDKDVDGQSDYSIINLFESENYINVATTAFATLEFLREITVLEGKDVLIINRSKIIGKPLSYMLTNENATVTVAHSKTKDLISKMKYADIIISGIGKPEYFENVEFKEGAIVIDLGYSLDENNIPKGDFKNIYQNSTIRYLPSKGGIGKLNSNIILRNTYLNGVRNGK